MQINQIIWVIRGENQSVIPVKIVEKITKETLEGIKNEFVVETVSGKKVSLSTINGPHFLNLQELTEYLQNAANALINNIVNDASLMARKLKNTDVQPQIPVQENIENDTIIQEEAEMITLPDGRQARVRIKMPEAM